MTTIAMMLGGAITNALAFSGSNFLFSQISRSAERKRHNLAMEKLQEERDTWNEKEIETLDQEQIQKLYAKYEAVLGGLITKQLKQHMCFAYSRAVQLVRPSVHCQVDDITELANSLSEGPFIDLALSSLTCKLYHEYGHMLAPLDAAFITSSHASRKTDQAPKAPQAPQHQDQDQDQAEDY